MVDHDGPRRWVVAVWSRVETSLRDRRTNLRRGSVLQTASSITPIYPASISLDAETTRCGAFTMRRRASQPARAVGVRQRGTRVRCREIVICEGGGVRWKWEFWGGEKG